jgi:very-short-patch-repair endonuclease
MDGITLTPTHILYRALSVMAADATSPLDHDERTALICWLHGQPVRELILLPHDVLQKLVPYISARRPEMVNELASAIGEPSDFSELVLPFDSPLENDFYLTWHEQALDLLYPLTPQCSVKGGAYRLDFAYPPLQFGIELDGYTYHSDREAFTQDRKRQREIEALGWRIVRFSGDELRADIVACVRDAVHQLDIWKRMKE